jgi:hypothetical protein
MSKTHLGARLLLALVFVNGLFHLIMLTFNIIGIPMGLIH